MTDPPHPFPRPRETLCLRRSFTALTTTSVGGQSYKSAAEPGACTAAEDAV